MDGEGVEARRLDVGWPVVGVVNYAGWLVRGDDGRVGTASSCASPLSAAIVESMGGMVVRVHLDKRCNGPVVERHAL